VLACAGGAGLLAASQFTDIFQLTPPGGEALTAIEASDQHGYATLILAGFALLMLVLGLAAGSTRAEGASLSLGQVAFVAVAVCGVAGLLIFLIGDLPDVNKVGTLDDPRESFIDAKAEPQAGFWLELVGSVVLAGCGAALATMRPGVPPLTDIESGPQQDESEPPPEEPAEDGERSSRLGGLLRRG
jgi:hypothetical protein